MPNTDRHSPAWLRHLQENSWEAEILISGGALFALVSASDQLISIAKHLKFSAPFVGLDEVTLILMVALKGITIGFLLHLVLRGLWISLVCLNHAFPNGIITQQLKLSEKYRAQAEKYNLTDTIVSLDKFSGLIFFGSFAFVLILLGYLFVAIVTGFSVVITSQLLGDSFTAFIVAMLLFVFPVLLYLFDVISGGLIRRFRVSGKLFYPVYIVMNSISLGFIYRPWLQILFTNTHRWKVALFFIAFAIATSAYANMSLAKLFYWRSITDWHQFPGAPFPFGKHDTWYSSALSEGEVIHLACISDKIVSGSYLRLFIPYRAGYDDGIIEARGEHFSDIVSVSIDEVPAGDLEWRNHRHEITGQTGIEAILTVDHLSKGRHEVLIVIKDDFLEGKQPIRIPFWKDEK